MELKVCNLESVRVKGCESECFRIKNGVWEDCIMSLRLFNVNMDAVMKEVKIRIYGGDEIVGITWSLSCG